MNVLYGVEPDLCINYPEILTDASQDIIVPKFFHSQISHLACGNFGNATEATLKIINSLQIQQPNDLLIFRSSKNGLVYFHNQEIGLEGIEKNYADIDLQHPLDRYLLSLLKISSLWECKIVFLTLSPELIHKSLRLKFDIGKPKDLVDITNSWIQPEMIVNLQTILNPLSQIEWQDDTWEFQREINTIEWVDM